MTLKVVHSSDWHLGKKLFKHSRLDEQKLFLSWLEVYLEEKQIDILLISGDIFDTPTPPNDALKLYFDFLNAISAKNQTDIIIISGNHDSTSFISAPEAILNNHKIHIRTKLSKDINQNHVFIKKDQQTVIIKTLPYFRSYDIYNCLEKESSSELTSEEIQNYLIQFFQTWPENTKTDDIKLIMAHHAFGDFAATGSEHVLQLAGLESLSTSWIGKDFDYMALGHIHSTQKIHSELDIYYSGSPIGLRFSERQKKNILFIEWDKQKNKTITKVEIPNFRPIIQLSEEKKDLIKIIKEEFLKCEKGLLPAFFEIKCFLDDPDNDFSDKVFNLFKKNQNELLSFIPIYKNNKDDLEEIEEVNKLHGLGIQELFTTYYRKKYPNSEAVPEDILKNFNELLNEVNHEDS